MNTLSVNNIEKLKIRSNMNYLDYAKYIEQFSSQKTAEEILNRDSNHFKLFRKSFNSDDWNCFYSITSRILISHYATKVA